MTMDLSVDVAFHIDRFRTYDLLSQGTHRIKIKMWHQVVEGDKIYAHPYLLPEKKFSKRNKSA